MKIRSAYATYMAPATLPESPPSSEAAEPVEDLDQALADEFAKMADDTPEETVDEVVEPAAEESAPEEKPTADETPTEPEKPTDETVETPTETPAEPEAEVSTDEETVVDEVKPYSEEDAHIPEHLKPQEQQTEEEEEKPEVSEEDIQARKAKVQSAIEERFQLSEEETELLMTNPNEVLPKYAGRIFMELFESLFGGLRQEMPSLVQNMMQATQAQERGKAAFYKEWPELNNPAFEPVITRIMQNHRQMNPNASMEDAIREVGSQAWIALRLPMDGLMRRAGAADIATKTPAGQPQPAPPRQPAGHTPPPPPPKQPETNPFTALADEILEEDM